MTASPRDRGELAIVLHSHMPYVEGFGTWPFGEEWLFEAMASAYLPLIDLLEPLADAGARDVLTVGVTPVLADQLVIPGVGERFLRFMHDVRRESHRIDIEGLERAGQRQAADALRALGSRLRDRGGSIRGSRSRPRGRAATAVASAA